jgi:type IV secretion system protein TrbL
VDLGVYIAFSKIDTTGLPLSTSSLLTAVFAIVARLVILGAFLWVAALLVLAWVESYVAIAGGVLFLGFGGFRATAQYAENYLNYLVFLGVRLFLFYLLLGVGMTIFGTTITGMPPTATPQEMAELVAMAVIFAALILRIPGNTADRVAGSASFGLAAALRSF